MPMSIVTTAGFTDYAPVMIGPYNVTNLLIDVSTLTTAEVDSKGYLKPGTVFQLSSDTGILISAGSQTIFGVSIEPVLINKASGSNSTLSTDPDIIIAVATNGLVNRDIAEDNLGRAYSANELAAFRAAGSRLQYTTT